VNRFYIYGDADSDVENVDIIKDFPVVINMVILPEDDAAALRNGLIHQFTVPTTITTKIIY